MKRNGPSDDRGAKKVSKEEARESLTQTQRERTNKMAMNLLRRMAPFMTPEGGKLTFSAELKAVPEVPKVKRKTERD